ncbi:RNA polymerase sigma factor SigJ [Ruania zhangjianzhongii]|uniref:RNA polymerase sigma factor SigJ n=1 Tax=Ruania zhangjianzhongii TaxID=2603206 RepID=UPI0011CBC8B9|nr:RNA polymerase sigma factor SigJ [Ruania zhangjianzhongii]
MEEVFEDKALLMNIAYRLLGTVSEAEDAVQDAFVRWYSLEEGERDRVASPTGWLVTVTTRICLDVLGSARVRRERYVGEWLPEPVPTAARWTSHSVTDQAIDPADRVSLDESLGMALLVVLESMTPAERVSFTLHDVFGYTFAEVGAMVGRSEQACRRLASSARHRVRQARRARATASEHALVVSRFKEALVTGDLDGLMASLDPEATVVPDGRGIVAAALEPVVGAERIASYLLAIREQVPEMTVTVTAVNGRAGLVSRDGAGHPLAVMAVDVAGDRIVCLWAIRNPEKLSAYATEEP